jgi:hypothetical protein
MSVMLSPRTPRYFQRSAEEDDELGLADMRTEMGADGEWKAPEALRRQAEQRAAQRRAESGATALSSGSSWVRTPTTAVAPPCQASWRARC